MYDYREIMMSVIRGEAAQIVPFAPRLEIWFRCNELAGTLPDKYKKASLKDIIEDLDVGYNFMIPDYLQYGDIRNTYNRGLGPMYSLTANAFQAEFENAGVKQIAKQDGDKTIVRYETPYGNLQTAFVYSETMKRTGVTVPAKTEKLVKSEKDFAAAGYIFENAEIVPQYEIYDEFVKTLGNRGISNIMAINRASGIHYVMMELMEYEKFIYALVDFPEEMEKLASQVGKYIDKVVANAINSSADLITVGAHFDKTLTYRPFFQEYLMPDLKRYAKKIHDSGKFLACHTDSDNAGLLDLYVESGIDVMDSVAIEPLVSQTYREVRAVTGNHITLYGLIPSITLLANSMHDLEFDRFIDKLFSEMQEDGARNIILAVADTTPAGADFSRVEKIAKLSKQLKPI